MLLFSLILFHFETKETVCSDGKYDFFILLYILYHLWRLIEQM